jgi:hypothetical protein
MPLSTRGRRDEVAISDILIFDSRVARENAAVFQIKAEMAHSILAGSQSASKSR